jgi:hypothetical protein
VHLGCIARLNGPAVRVEALEALAGEDFGAAGTAGFERLAKGDGNAAVVAEEQPVAFRTPPRSP